MSGVPNAALRELINTTLQRLPYGDIEYALAQRSFSVCNHWFRRDRMKSDGGTSIEKLIQLDRLGRARYVDLYGRIEHSQQDTLSKFTAPWVQMKTYWMVDRREILRNRGKAKIVDLLKSRRVDAMLEALEKFEADAFKAPASVSDTNFPRGLFYWLNAVPKTAVTGVNGGTSLAINDSGFSGCQILYSGDAGATPGTNKAGIDGAEKDLWRNYADTFTNIDKTFVSKLRKAFRATKFQSPLDLSEIKEGPKSKQRIYMSMEDANAYEDLASNRGDTGIGPDVEPYNGATSFKRVPIEDHDSLDHSAAAVTANPIIAVKPVVLVNHSHFYPVVEQGNWKREGEAMSDVNQPDVMITHVDWSWQYLCDNVRHAGAVLSRQHA